MPGTDGARYQVTFSIGRVLEHAKGSIEIRNLDTDKVVSGLVYMDAPALEQVGNQQVLSIEGATGSFYSGEWFPGVISARITVGEPSGTTTTTEATTTTVDPPPPPSIPPPRRRPTHDHRGPHDHHHDTTTSRRDHHHRGADDHDVDHLHQHNDHRSTDHHHDDAAHDHHYYRSTDHDDHRAHDHDHPGADNHDHLDHHDDTTTTQPPDPFTFSIGDTIDGEIETAGASDVWTFTTPGQTVFFDVTAIGELGETGCNFASLDLHPHRTRRRSVRPQLLSSCNSDQGPVELPAGTYTLTIDGGNKATPPATTRSPLGTCRAPERSMFAIGDVISGEIETPACWTCWSFTTAGPDRVLRRHRHR